MTKKVAFYTLGCKANQYDTESMKEAIRDEPGCQVVPFSGDEDPDAVVVNTCSVTNGADRKSRKYVRRAARKGDLVMVTGCYTTLDSDDVAEISGVDVIFTNLHKNGIVDILNRAESGFRGKVESSTGKNGNLDNQVISKDSSHTRAFLKIQDGCSNSCTFCKVQFLRGPARSKSPSRIMEEAGKLGDHGFRELVLTGINLAEYGGEEYGLAELIRKLSRLEKISRIRLSSINPDGITRELLEAFKNSEKTCPYFHVPLQSGSNRILEKMNRGYTREFYLKKINLIKQYLSDPTIGTDLMVGFPGEEETDFARTKETVRKAEYINGHVFRYSPRDATPASDFEERVNSSTKKRRADELRSLLTSVSLSYRRGFENSGREMIIEEPSDKIDGWRGYSRNYLNIHLSSANQSGDLEPGETVEAKVVDVKEGFCLAKPLNYDRELWKEDRKKLTRDKKKAGSDKNRRERDHRERANPEGP
ncbi:MAG: tRNA (N(6)-L-threonylcarbamoyladenosine(37)-C(2))-methylthiotransferase MtaB [Candidatus Bipolaricaulia bacterium]